MGWGDAARCRSPALRAMRRGARSAAAFFFLASVLSPFAAFQCSCSLRAALPRVRVASTIRLFGSSRSSATTSEHRIAISAVATPADPRLPWSLCRNTARPQAVPEAHLSLERRSSPQPAFPAGCPGASALIPPTSTTRRHGGPLPGGAGAAFASPSARAAPVTTVFRLIPRLRELVKRGRHCPEAAPSGSSIHRHNDGRPPLRRRRRAGSSCQRGDLMYDGGPQQRELLWPSGASPF